MTSRLRKNRLEIGKPSFLDSQTGRHRFTIFIRLIYIPAWLFVIAAMEDPEGERGRNKIRTFAVASTAEITTPSVPFEFDN